MAKSSLDISLERASAFAIKNKDVIANVSRYSLYNDEPQIYSYLATYPRGKKNSKDHDSSAGFSFSRKIALMRVLGEGLERYCLDNVKVPIFTTCSVKQLKQPHLEPETFSPFSQAQLSKVEFKKFRIDENSKFQWIKGTSLLTGNTKLLPAQLVTYNYKYLKNEPLITIPLSTGVAAGVSLEDALCRAIFEVIERDSYMISYLNKLPSPKVELNKIKDSEFKEILSIFKRYRLELTVLDLTTNIEIPSFAAITIDRTGLGPAVSIGLKAGFEEESVIIGAIEESLMTRSWCRDKFIYSESEYKMPKEITTIDERAHFWFSTDMIKELDFWIKDNKNVKKKINKKNNGNSLNRIKEIFKKGRMDILYVDITNKKIKQAGFIVVRVIIPQLQQLYLDERYSFLGEERLYKTPIIMKYLKKSRTEQEFNKTPHPFL